MTFDESSVVHRVEPYALNPEPRPQESSLGHLLQDLESGRNGESGQNVESGQKVESGRATSSPGPENMTSADGLEVVEN